MAGDTTHTNGMAHSNTDADAETQKLNVDQETSSTDKGDDVDYSSVVTQVRACSSGEKGVAPRVLRSRALC